MKDIIALILTLTLTGCSSEGTMPGDLETHAPTSKWFDIGYQEAASGNDIKEDTVLSEWYGEEDINRQAYLQGYAKGQTVLCKSENIIELAKAGKEYPASCNSVSNAEQLKQGWRQLVEK
ncbi:DUF2799 domain-containing protein [Pragia fontium]|uniref:DUF2799 domain-containing protein n=1 Tax=Pragia fontium DSM 5563 = ATCC 49100 TaxID=1122977 RepID=A0AAJ4WBT2_9GAMM|nr:DUF2799 domain-containing protein [Pragia fontium]AKJ42959.1 hypothetical protein QQ39_13525 [Pragia fontium]SFD06855.1 Protein of unknown function [Pragia fontium DSM 5563 = ATCC 49100]VEJ56275.1 lipoprotein [Pragia fontium]